MPIYNYEYLLSDPSYKAGISLVEYFSERILRFLPITLKTFPSHGVDHSVSIIGHINEFIENWCPNLSESEIFLLYVGAWLHDIGCINQRKNHEVLSYDIFIHSETLSGFLGTLDSDLPVNLKYLIYSHRYEYDINQVPKIHGRIRLRLICSIFRIMDALEISSNKCPLIVYEVIKPKLVEANDYEALNYWEGHMCIQSITFQKPFIFIASSDSGKCKQIIEKAKSEISTVDHVFKASGIEIPNIELI